VTVNELILNLGRAKPDQLVKIFYSGPDTVALLDLDTIEIRLRENVVVLTSE